MQEEKQILINTKDVAELTGMSVSWVTKWRHRIIGARYIIPLFFYITTTGKHI